MRDMGRMGTDELKREFAKTMESITGTNNLASLADLARYAGEVWEEMIERGIEPR